MPETNKKNMLPDEGNPSFYNKLVSQLKLVWRLLGDSRVNFMLKFIPVGALVYLFTPDLVLGPFDDAAVLAFGLYTFVELCPQDVVEEHRTALGTEASSAADKIVDAEFKDKNS
ncbi:MAG: hypothetical protein OEZ02_04450 [Anaerolineae bacterium]|nr:hypothetical protein [Anaerolineae bacterium]